MIIQDLIKIYNEVFGVKTKVKEMFQMSRVLFVWFILLPVPIFTMFYSLFNNILVLFIISVFAILILSFLAGLHRKYSINRYFGSISNYSRKKKNDFFSLVEIKYEIVSIKKLEMLDEIICKEIGKS